MEWSEAVVTGIFIVTAGAVIWKFLGLLEKIASQADEEQ